MGDEDRVVSIELEPVTSVQRFYIKIGGGIDVEGTITNTGLLNDTQFVFAPTGEDDGSHEYPVYEAEVLRKIADKLDELNNKLSK